MNGSTGTYVVLLALPVDSEITVGALGRSIFKSGVYAYVGSALGPGGLNARLARHARGPRRPHWHIDHLLARAAVTSALVSTAGSRLECSWASWWAERCAAPFPGFGASDCRCPSHLFYLGKGERAEEIIRAAGCELRARVLEVHEIGGR